MPMATKTASRKKTAPGKRRTTAKRAPRKWSARVMQRSDALNLEGGIFKSQQPDKIARSLKRSAEKSKRRKGTPCQSAMSMLNFYINRAGKNLPQRQKSILERTRNKLRRLFGRPERPAKKKS